MSLYGAPTALTGTNPFSFALPAQPTPRLIDQASSAVAWVRIRDAAAAGEPIPQGWALDAHGAATTDAAAALLGPLLPFGGAKGSNIALVIELLSVLSGAAFSMDAPDFASGTQPPRVGMFLLALDPRGCARMWRCAAGRSWPNLVVPPSKCLCRSRIGPGRKPRSTSVMWWSSCSY
jgi:(2R)-3-sulfolactate dehydrogenase (NADP+)